MTDKESRYINLDFIDPDFIDISTEDMKKVWRMCRPKIKPGYVGKLIITSTPRGDNHFCKELFYGKDER